MIFGAPLLALVGGFLGAGRTTLLLRAARQLEDRHISVAIITNAQGAALVDTRLAKSAGIATEEVAGGCFCCRFSEFTASALRLLASSPQVIFAEPVGSCVDLSATTLQPLKQMYGNRFRLAPFTVLVDPARARQLLAPGADPSLSYIFRNQLAEADLVCLTKSDRFQGLPELPGGFNMRLSARTGDGVAAWLRELLSGSRRAATRTVDVDYDVYAAAEASLAWLNWDGSIHLRAAMSPALVVGPLLDGLDHAFTRAGVEIAHLKILDQCRTAYMTAGICHNGDEQEVDGDLDAPPTVHHELVLNIRARGAPEILQSVVKHAIARLPGTASVRLFECFRPSAPKPEHRIAAIKAKVAGV
jgi:hypothetical protein